MPALHASPRTGPDIVKMLSVYIYETELTSCGKCFSLLCCLVRVGGETGPWAKLPRGWLCADLTVTLRAGRHNYLIFTNEETEARRGCMNYQISLRLSVAKFGSEARPSDSRPVCS